jgi:hypothetical protein
MKPVMKYIHWLASYVLALSLCLHACTGSVSLKEPQGADVAVPESASLDKSRQEIHALLDSFNVAAAKSDFDRYFSFYTPDAVFMGTDATERWELDSFKVWAKPYFDKKTTWNFLSLKRNIYFDKSGKLAWFDELLSTQMKICRGSGVVVRDGKDWKISQYVLSMTIPNSQVDQVVKNKTSEEDRILQELTK